MATLERQWEQRYANDPRYRNRYPWSEVVSFIYRSAPRDRDRSEVSIVEVGCGTGNNLWFAAREGFRVAGIDVSQTAIEYARQRFAEDGLTGDLQVGDFSSLPFASGSFDLAIDRGSLSLATRQGAIDCVQELKRILKPNGLFQCGPFSDRDSSNHRSPDPDGVVRGIPVGVITAQQARFYSLQDIRDLFADGWDFEVLQHIDETDMMSPGRVSHSRWLAVVRSKG